MSRHVLLTYCLVVTAGLLVALLLAVVRDAATLWLPLGLGAVYFGLAARGEFQRLRGNTRREAAPADETRSPTDTH